jgi:hypothetical protein
MIWATEDRVNIVKALLSVFILLFQHYYLFYAIATAVPLVAILMVRNCCWSFYYYYCAAVGCYTIVTVLLLVVMSCGWLLYYCYCAAVGCYTIVTALPLVVILIAGQKIVKALTVR